MFCMISDSSRGGEGRIDIAVYFSENNEVNTTNKFMINLFKQFYKSTLNGGLLPTAVITDND